MQAAEFVPVLRRDVPLVTSRPALERSGKLTANQKQCFVTVPDMRPAAAGGADPLLV